MAITTIMDNRFALVIYLVHIIPMFDPNHMKIMGNAVIKVVGSSLRKALYEQKY